MKKYIQAALWQLTYSPVLAVVLCIEFVVMMLCFSLSYGALELYLIRQDMYERNNMDEWYYSNGEDNDEFIEMFEAETGRSFMTIESADGPDSFTHINFYSASVFENMEILVSKGESIDTTRDYGAVPCLITSALANDYEVGQICEIRTDHSLGSSAAGKFYICGVIKNDVVFSPTYAFDYDTTAIVAYDPEGVIKRSRPVTFHSFNAHGIDGFAEKYAKYIETMELFPFEYYYSARNELERKLIMPYVLLTIVFGALSLTGLIAYGIASNVQLRRQTALFELVGAKRRQIVLIAFLRILMLVALPAVLSLIGRSYMKTTDIAQTTLLSMRGQVIAISVCFGVMFISSVFSVIGIGRHSISDRIKDI